MCRVASPLVSCIPHVSPIAISAVEPCKARIHASYNSLYLPSPPPSPQPRAVSLPAWSPAVSHLFGRPSLILSSDDDSSAAASAVTSTPARNVPVLGSSSSGASLAGDSAVAAMCGSGTVAQLRRMAPVHLRAPPSLAASVATFLDQHAPACIDSIVRVRLETGAERAGAEGGVELGRMGMWGRSSHLC